MSYSNYQSKKVPGFVRYLADLMRYRHLCWNLVGSDLRSRFRRSRLGILWAVIQPLAYSLIIAWAWGAIFQDQTYWSFAVYVFSGMLVWEYFTGTVNNSLDGLINAVGHLRQSRVPFFIFQARTPMTGMVIFLAGILGLVVLLAALQRLPPLGYHYLLVPAFMGVLLMFLLPLSIIASIVGAKYRDVKHIVTLSFQALFFLSPVMLARSYMEASQLAVLKYVNPLVPLIDMFRDPLLDGKVWEVEDVITVAAWGGGLWILAFVAALRSGRRLVFAL